MVLTKITLVSTRAFILVFCQSFLTDFFKAYVSGMGKNTQKRIGAGQ